MALNRYSKLPTQNLNNNQVLPNMGVLDSVLAKKQQAYDTTAATAAKFQSDVGQLQGYGDYAKNRLAQIDADTKNFVGSIANQDLGSPEVRNKLSGYIQSVSSNPELKSIQQAKALRDTQETQMNELAAKGKLSPSQEYRWKKGWDAYSKTGQTNSIIQEPLMEAADLVDSRGKLVSMIKASGRDAIKYLSNGMAYKENSKGVSGSRIAKAVDDQLNTYANSHAGRQEKMDFDMLVDQGQLPKGMSFKDYLRREVMATAQNYTHSDFSTNLDSVKNAKRKEDQEEATILTGTEAFANPIIGSNNKFNPSGSQRTTSTPMSWLFGTAFGNQELTEEDLKDPQKNMIRLGAKAQGITEEEYANKYAGSLNVPVMNYVKQTPRTDLTTLVSKDGAGLINSAPIIDASGNTVGTLRDILINQGVEDNPEALEKATKSLQVTGKVVPSAVAADGYRISMNGQDYILNMTPSIEMKGKNATKEEKRRMEEYNEHRFKAGYVDVIPTQEGEAIRFWNDKLNDGEGGYDYKLNN